MEKRRIDGICPRCKVAPRYKSRGYCLECQRAFQTDHRTNNPKASTDWNLKYKYGLSLADRHLMMSRQGFRCASCELILFPEAKPSVDHCHDTGEIRGILCNACNLSLGLMKENPELIRRLAIYADRLESNKRSPTPSILPLP